MFGDHHALWIDPTDPGRLLSGTDGGFWISNDFGETGISSTTCPWPRRTTWASTWPSPTTSWAGSRTMRSGGGPTRSGTRGAFGRGTGSASATWPTECTPFLIPRDPNLIYYNGHFGDITRIDMANADERYIQPYPPGPNGGGAELEDYRFHWNSPVHLSPTNPDVIYYGGNVLFRPRTGERTGRSSART